MICLEDRQQTAAAIEQAHVEGARLEAACGVAGIDMRGTSRAGCRRAVPRWMAVRRWSAWVTR